MLMLIVNSRHAFAYFMLVGYPHLIIILNTVVHLMHLTVMLCVDTLNRCLKFSSGTPDGEGRVVVVPKFHSWGPCTMSLTNL